MWTNKIHNLALKYQMEKQWAAEYLVGDPTSKVLDGELRERHLWLHIQRIVAMVIVTFLKKCVVCCLATNEYNWDLEYLYISVCYLLQKACWCNSPHLGKTALVIQNPEYPMRLSSNEVNAGLVVTECDVLPWDLLSAVLLLQGDQMQHNVTFSVSHHK